MSFRGVLSYFKNYSLGLKNVTYLSNENAFLFNYLCKDESICDSYELIFSPGTYKIELWGAQGGDARYQNQDNLRPDSGGKGAYVKGLIQFIGTTKLYLYIGGKGEDQIYIDNTTSKGGFNGGGKGGVDYFDSIYPESGAGGGGATDIRIFKGNDEESLKSRIIVAGAGGGGCSTNNTSPNYGNFYQYSPFGGSGGGLKGENITEYGVGGNQTDGYFGRGGDGFGNLFEEPEPIMGGGSATGGSGSGYYGGYTNSPNENHSYELGGSGGSSFISGHKDCIAIGNNSSSLNISSIHWSDVYFTETEMKEKGDPDFKNPYNVNENGHSGNGCAKITIISSTYSLNIFPTCKISLINHNSFSLFACVIILSFRS